MKTYTVRTRYKDSGTWLETGDPCESFKSLDEAKKCATSCEDGDYGPGELMAEVTDDDTTAVVFRHYWNVMESEA